MLLLLLQPKGSAVTGHESLVSALEETRRLLQRYVVWPSSAAADAATLWVAHTYALDAFDSTPRLVLRSAEKQSGKTRAQEVIECVVKDPLPSANASVPAIYRSLVDRQPTILLDEYDTYFGSTIAREHAEDLRGLLNAGHRRGKPVLRCVGPNSQVQEFPCFAPVCLAGIRGLPDTIEDRSVIIDMRRRRHDETVEPFRAVAGWNKAEPIRAHFEAWAELHDGRWPPVCDDGSLFPAGVTDRAADVWEPMLTIGAWAGEQWSQRARQAATHFVSNQRVSDESDGVRLLRDIRLIWPDGEEVLYTRDLIARLCGLEEAGWAERWQSNGQTGSGASGQLARELRHYGITSRTVRVGEQTAKGYRRESFVDAWQRYVPEKSSQASQRHNRDGPNPAHRI
jgi:hypothetical protein